MTSLLGQLGLLVAFSAALAMVVSGYREEEPAAIWKGSLRRFLQFSLAVIAIGGVAQVVDLLLLRPR
ncbi:MAG: hypothetical protein EYC70_16380 [Planctomycetota bacterium]|nr:MAG: hypothetical protein EYC70_16380 [Planctomycetota bacterium]